MLNLKDVNDFLVYLLLLEKINKKLLKMYDIHTFENDAFTKYQYAVDEFSDPFFRLTGYEFKRSINKIISSKKNGLVSLASINELFQIEDSFQLLLLNHYDAIDNLRVFRNKSHHVPHKVKFNSIGATNSEFSISYNYSNEDYKLKSEDLTSLIIDLNKIFISILSVVQIKIESNVFDLILRDSKVEALFSINRYKKLNKFFVDDSKKHIINILREN